MVEINNEMEDKLNEIGVELGELQRITKIMQTYFDNKQTLEIEDIQTILQLLKSRITEIKNNFNLIQSELEIN